MRTLIRLGIEEYFWNLALALDQLANVVLGSYPDETFSCRAYRKSLAGQWFWKGAVWILDHLFFWQADHCRQSYESEAARNHSPKEFADG